MGFRTNVEHKGGASIAPTWEGMNDSEDTTVIRIQSKQPAELLLTPMAATVLQTMMEEQGTQTLSPDFELDEMFRKLVASPSLPSHIRKKLFFHARLRRSTLTVLRALQLDPPLHAKILKEPAKSTYSPLGMFTTTLYEGICSGAVGGRCREHCVFSRGGQSEIDSVNLKSSTKVPN